MPHRLVLIEWVDSVGAGRNWSRIETDEPPAAIMRSVGWLIVDGPTYKVVVPHHHDANDRLGMHESGCGDMAIPTVAVVRMVDLVEAAS